MEFDFLGLAGAVLAVLSFQVGSKFLNYFSNLIMSVQASLASEYVKRVKKIPESRAINPETWKTLKNLKLKPVNCVSIKITHFISGHHDGFENVPFSKYFLFDSSVQTRTYLMVIILYIS